jgi:8-oxo-dGTP diphosphatase
MTETIVNPGFIEGDYLHVVAAIIWHPLHSDRLLISRRQKGKHLEHLWEFPGGKMEDGEQPWQALLRELDEEIGIEVLDGAPFMKVFHRYPERSVLLDIWTVDDFRGDAHGRESQSLAWVELDRLDDYRFPPADEPVLDAIRRSATTETRRRS